MGHVSFADPVCEVLANTLFNAAKSVGVHVHKGGTYLCMEGPLFSTRAESNVYRQWGVSIIGMTNLQESQACTGGRNMLQHPCHGDRL